MHHPKKKIQVSFTIRERENEEMHRGFINALQYDQTTGNLFSAGSDSIIRKWSISSQKGYCLQSFEHHCDWVNDISLVNDGTRLLSASSDTTVKVWDTQNGAVISTIKYHRDCVRCLSYAKDGSETVASAGLDKIIYIWDVNTLTKTTSINNNASKATIKGVKNSIYSLATNGKLLAAGSTENVIRIWDLRTYEKIVKFRGHSENIRALVMNKDGTMCLSGSSDGTIRLWSIGQQRCIGQIRCHSDSVWALQTDPSFSFVISGGRDQHCYSTSISNLSSCELLFVDEKPIQKLQLDGTDSNHPKHVWAATLNSTIKRWPLFSPTSFPSTPKDFEPRIKSPDLILPGAPKICKYVLLNNRREIVTKDSDGNVEKWDVLQAKKVHNYGKINIENVIKEKENLLRKVWIPSWFSVDIKCGILEITLDEGDVFSAWVSARDASFTDKMSDAKINFGGMLLRSLFEQWPNSYNDSDDDENSPLRGFYSLPPHTPIIIKGVCGEDFLRPLFRTTVRDASMTNDGMMLRDNLPGWVLDVVQHNQFPKFNKIPFYLQPHNTYTGKIAYKKDRLSATEMLQVRKVMEHIYEKILYPAESDDRQGTDAPQIMPSQIPDNIEELIELSCNDQKLDPDMDLRTVKHLIWKSGGDLLIVFRPIK